MVSQILAWILFEGGSTREIDACNGIVSATSDILMSFKPRNELGNEVLVPKCISALLFILVNLLQSRPRFSSETMEGNVVGTIPDSTGKHAFSSIPPDAENKLDSDGHDK